jgi:endogenous inhibitor of DNA gyrase (YacG/DUF329 family)
MGERAMRRKIDRPAELPCAQCGVLFKTAGRRPDARFCSKGCVDDAKRHPLSVLVCAQCGQAKEYPPGHVPDLYCSWECRNRARTRKVDRTCETCGQAFQTKRAHLATGRGRYCSRECRARRNGPPVLRACRACGKQTRRPPCTADRPYCSRACYFARGTRLEHTCEQCQRTFTKSTGRRVYRFCSQRCYHRARRPAQRHCAVCRQAFPIPRWRQAALFCSHACANRGRQRTPRQEDLERNQRILELRAQGLLVKQIKRQLDRAGTHTGLSEAGIRQVLSRAKLAAGRPIRTVTLSA